MSCVKKLKVVWPEYHHDFDVISQPAIGDGVLVVHVAKQSVDAMTMQTAWAVANGDKTKFRGVKDGNIVWVDDYDEALFFARRKDAEAFSAEDEDAWCILSFSLKSEDPQPIDGPLRL